jgi:ankyrin repeat protein
MKIQSLLLVSVIGMSGCKEANDASVEKAATKSEALQARERSKAANLAELNEKLTERITFGSAAEIQDLFKQGATMAAKNRYGLPVVFMAAQRGDPAILEVLIQAGADVNAQIGTTYNDDAIGYAGTSDGTPLGYAAGAGKVEAMKVLQKAGADVNGGGPEGVTPLMFATERGQLESIQWLVANGATAGREKALATCARVVNPGAKHKEIVRLLSQ